MGLNRPPDLERDRKIIAEILKEALEKKNSKVSLQEKDENTDIISAETPVGPISINITNASSRKKFSKN